MKLYKVGGWVRDHIMGLKSKDLDLAMEAPSYDAMRDWIATNGYTIFQERPQFQTIRTGHPEFGPVDIVLCRLERDYNDGRHPDTVEIGTIYDDLARRDFTVNAIAIDTESNELIDPHGGQQDIEQKLLRCVGNAEERFKEDSLRLLRAVRFSITKGFKISEPIVRCFNDLDLIESLDNAKIERWYEELKRCFAFSTYDTLRMLEQFPLLRDKLFEETNMWLMPTLSRQNQKLRNKRLRTGSNAI